MRLSDTGFISHLSKTDWGLSVFGLMVRAVRIGLLLALLAFAVVFALVVKARVGAPFDLEWMEGLSIDSALRLSSGQFLYPPPNADFMPSVYTPLYHALIAGIFKVFGASYAAARLVSVLSTLFIVCALFLIVKRESNSTYWGLVSAGLFLAAFRFTGAWYDLARADMLALAFVLVAAWIALRQKDRWAAAVVGVLVFASVFTKQTTVFFLPAFVLLYALRDRTGAVVFISVSVGLITLGILLAHVLTGGWSTYYTVALPMNQPLTRELAWRFWGRDMLGGVPFLLGILVLLVLLSPMVRWADFGRGVIFMLLLTVLGIGVAFLSRARIGGYDNVLMLGITPLVLLVGAGGGVLERRVATAWPRWCPYLQVLLTLLVIGQLVLWVYSPMEQVPTKGDYLADRRLREYLAALEGKVYSPQRGFLVRGPQGPASVHQYSIMDVSLDKTRRVGFPADLARRFQTGYYRFVLLDRRWQWELEKYFSCYYVESPVHSIRVHSPPTRTGLDVQLDTILVYAGPQKECNLIFSSD